MSETVLDTLASQLRQDEQAARLFTQHLGNVDTQLHRLSQRLETSVPGSDERGSALAALDGYADAVRRLELGVQALFAELQRMQQTSQGPGVSAALAEQSATLRALQGTLTAALAEQAAALRSLQGDLSQATTGSGAGLQSFQGHLQAALAEQSLTLRALKHDLTTALAEQGPALRSLQGNLIAALAEQGATLRSLEGGAAGSIDVHADFDRLRAELLANQERQFAMLAGIVREAVSEELRRAQQTAPQHDAYGSTAMAEQAAALRSLQGDLTAVLTEQAAAIRGLQASGLDAKSIRSDLERVRAELLANQERQFGNLVGVVRTLLQQSEDVVVALGRVPKSAQAGRAFEMLRLSSANWETSDRPH